ncbi:MAG TPA: ABC transporter permease, partial [Rhodanobacteraceae bacterium]|nr:ABC transporter permease [Rhodanobacteraceae bacterium]
EQGLLTLKRALPMPSGAYLFAKMLMAMLFAAIVTLLLMALAFSLGHVRMPIEDWIALLATAMLGVLPFCAIGLFVGTLIGGQGAPAVVNLIYLPMSFLSGLWLPLPYLPGFLQQIAPLWPAYHLGRLALTAAGQGDGHRIATHVAVLAGFTIAFFAIAQRRLRRAG